MIHQIAARVRPAYRARYSIWTLLTGVLLGVEAGRNLTHACILSAFLILFLFIDHMQEEDLGQP